MNHTENNLYILEGLIISEVLTLKEALTILGFELRKEDREFKPLSAYVFVDVGLPWKYERPYRVSVPDFWPNYINYIP